MVLQQVNKPREPIDCGLDVSGADFETAAAGRGFHRTLGQVIDGTGQSAAGLDQEFERIGLEGVEVNAGTAQGVFDVLTSELGIEGCEFQTVAEPAAQGSVDA